MMAGYARAVLRRIALRLLPDGTGIPRRIARQVAALGPVFHEQARRLEAALAETGRSARAVVLAEHNHFSAVLALNTADASFGGEITAFLREVR